VFAAAGVGVGLRTLDYERVPRVAMLSAAFFVASLIHVPVGPASVHLVLNGLVGLILGWAAFPALLIALGLQAVLFGYGGLTVLGVNTVVMGAPALCCYLLFSRWLRAGGKGVAFGLGFAAGMVGILGGCLLLAAALVTTGKEFGSVAELVVVAHLPVALVEGLITGSVVVFLRKVRPELLEAPRREGSALEAAHA
jgi:cobalt/nickel transport system permease protein